MGISTPHKKVKLVIGFIFKESAAFEKARLAVSKKIGPFDLESAIFNFTHTDYYAGEFGGGLKRKFLSLKRLVGPEDIYKVKLATNAIEKRLSESGKRLVNIDPGYITESKLILLTTKDHGHRIYLGKGIYAEVTLKFRNGSFGPDETTYPDYRTSECISFFNGMRAAYREGLK